MIGQILAALLLAAVVLGGWLMISDLRDLTLRELRNAELRRWRDELDEVVTGRVADYTLLGWLPEEEREL